MNDAVPTLIGSLAALISPLIILVGARLFSWVAKILIGFASLAVPIQYRSNIRSEWLADMGMLEGVLAKVRYSLNITFYALSIGRVLAGKRSRQLEWLKGGQRTRVWRRQIAFGAAATFLGISAFWATLNHSFGASNATSYGLSVTLFCEGVLLTSLAVSPKRSEDRRALSYELPNENFTLVSALESLPLRPPSWLGGRGEKDMSVVRRLARPVKIENSCHAFLAGIESEVDIGELQKIVQAAKASEDAEVEGEAYLDLAQAYEHLGNYLAADNAYECAGISPVQETAGAALSALGDLRARQNDFDGAIRAYQRATLCDDDYWSYSAFTNIATLLADKGAIADAITAYQRAMKSSIPEVNGYAADLLGDLFFSQGEPKLAESAYRIAISSGSEFWSAAGHTDLGRLLISEGDLVGATFEMGLAINSGIDIPAGAAAIILADAYADNGDWTEAKNIYLQALRVGDGWWTDAAHLSLADIHADEGDLKTAQTLYRQLAESADDEVAACASDRLGNLLAKLNNFEAARVAYQQAINANNKYWSQAAAVDLAQLLANDGDIFGAQIILRRIAESDESAFSGPAAKFLGDLLVKQQDFEAARDAYDRAVATGDDELRALSIVALGRLYAQTGDIDSAREAFGLAINASPRLHDIASKELDGLTLSRSDQQVMAALDELPSADEIQVAAAALVTPSEATGALHRLVRAGQVQQEVISGGRIRYRSLKGSTVLRPVR